MGDRNDPKTGKNIFDHEYLYITVISFKID